MEDNNFKIDIPFETKPPRLKEIVNKYMMGDVWIRDTPFGPVTDSLRIADRFGIKHFHVLRAIDKCRLELVESKFGLNQNLIETKYLAGSDGHKRNERKVDLQNSV